MTNGRMVRPPLETLVLFNKIWTKMYDGGTRIVA